MDGLLTLAIYSFESVFKFRVKSKLFESACTMGEYRIFVFGMSVYSYFINVVGKT